MKAEPIPILVSGNDLVAFKAEPITIVVSECYLVIVKAEPEISWKIQTDLC